MMQDRQSVKMKAIGLQNAVRAHYTAAQMAEAGYSKDLAYQLFYDVGKDKKDGGCKTPAVNAADAGHKPGWEMQSDGKRYAVP